MSTQMPLFGESTTERRKSKPPPQVEAIRASFSPKALVEELAVISEAAGGVERLRELVLALAFQGRLFHVARDSEGFPVSWSKRTLGEVAATITKGTTPTTMGFPFTTAGVRFIKVETVKEGRILRERITAFISEEAHKALSRSQLETGDVLFSIAGTIGETCVVRREDLPANTNQALAIIRGTAETFLPDFLRRQLDSFVAHAVKARARGGAMPNVSLGDLRDLEVAIPPLAEQKRIVAKVDELMALIDDLEAKQTKKREVGARLTKSALDALASAEGPEEFDAAWRRVVENFDVLIDRAEKVGDLRANIVELAMRGKLTCQAPGDERVPDLPARSWRTSSKIEDTTAAVDDDPPFAVPPTWRWVRWAALSAGTSSGWSPQCDSRPREGTEWGVLKVSAVSWFSFRPDENKALPASLEPRSEFAVRSGDFLMSRANTAELVGRSVVVGEAPQRLILSDKIIRCDFGPFVEKEFVNLFNRTRAAREHYVRRASGTSDSMKNISREVILAMPIPLPPIQEQRRIIAKVSGLMKVCDELEAKLRRAEEYAARLAEAAVRELVA